jgi:hypothetical protein
MKFLCFTALLISFTLRVYSQNDLSPEVIYEKVNNSVVIVLAYAQNGDIFQGSGVVVSSPDSIAGALVVTTHHIIKDAIRIEVKHYNRTFQTTEIIQKDEAKDILILKVLELDLQPITVGSSSNLRHGQRIYSIGSPEGFENTISEGIISGFRQLDNFVNVIQMTAPITEGSSGGAIVNGKGELIGLSLSGQHEGNIYFAIPVNDIIPLINSVQISKSDSIKTNVPDTIPSSLTENQHKNSNEPLNIPADTNFVLNEESDDNKHTHQFTTAEQINYIQKADIAYENEDYKQAIYYFTKHLETNANDEIAYFKRGCSHIKLKENAEAIVDFTKTLEQNPENFESYFYRGNAYFSISNYEKALNDYTKAISLTQNSAVLYYNRGLTNYKLSEYSNAVQDWEKAIQLNQNYARELNDIINKTKLLLNDN